MTTRRSSAIPWPGSPGTKAHIIRSGVAVSARQDPEAEALIVERAAATGVPLLLEGRELSVSAREASLAGQRLDLVGPDWRIEDARCALLGPHQTSNALVAVAAARPHGRGRGGDTPRAGGGALAGTLPGASPARPP